MQLALVLRERLLGQAENELRLRLLGAEPGDDRRRAIRVEVPAGALVEAQRALEAALPDGQLREVALDDGRGEPRLGRRERDEHGADEPPVAVHDRIPGTLLAAQGGLDESRIAPVDGT